MDNARLPAGVPLCQPPDSPTLPFLAAGVDPLLITVLHRLSMRALVRAAVAANLDKTEKLKLLLPPCSSEVCTVTNRESFSAGWRCSLCAWILTPTYILGTRWQQSHICLFTKSLQLLLSTLLSVPNTPLAEPPQLPLPANLIQTFRYNLQFDYSASDMHLN